MFESNSPLCYIECNNKGDFMNRGAYFSKHHLAKKYDLKGRIRTLLIGWTIFLIIFGITRYQPLQATLTSFALKMHVDWVSSCVNFIIHGFWVMFIPMITGTFMTLMAKQPFQEIRIYEAGLCFYNEKIGSEQFVPYERIVCSHGKRDGSFWLTVEDLQVKNRVYYWSDFTNDVTMQLYMTKFIPFSPY